MKIIDKNAFISKPYKMRCLISNLEFEDELHTFDTENMNQATDLVDTITKSLVTSFYYTVNGLKVEGDVEFYNRKDGTWSWTKAEELTLGSFLFTDHNKLEIITQIDNTNDLLEGCSLVTDTNFFVGGYLAK